MSVSNRIEATEVKDVIATGKRSQVPRLVCGLPSLVILQQTVQPFEYVKLEYFLNTDESWEH